MTAQIHTREGLFEVMAQIAAEREAAKPLVAELLKRDEPPWDDEIPEEWKTAGFVQELTREAEAILEHDVTKAVSYLQFALGLAFSIEERYPAVVSGHAVSTAFRHLSYAHQFGGSLQEALLASRSASATLEENDALIHEKTRADYMVGAIFSRMRRLEEAVPILDNCSNVFKSFGDYARVNRCAIANAYIDGMRGDFARVCERLLPIVETVSAIDDLHTQGSLLRNLAAAFSALGQLRDAEDALVRARSVYVSAKMPLEIDIVDWSLAQLRLQSGDRFADALHELKRLRALFLERQVVDTAALIGLDMVDALVALDRVPEARELIEDVIAEFSHAGLNDFAATALAYLRDLLLQGPAVREAIQQVRTYVLRHGSEDSPRPFTPLAKRA